MPLISRFYGIDIKMYFKQAEHNPPHVHAYYNDAGGAFEIETAKEIDGNLPPKAVSMVEEWIALHREELRRIWETQEFEKVQPLE